MTSGQGWALIGLGVIISLLLLAILLQLDTIDTTLRLIDVACPAPSTSS
jgi:hypothetical protein